MFTEKEKFFLLFFHLDKIDPIEARYSYFHEQRRLIGYAIILGDRLTSATLNRGVQLLETTVGERRKKHCQKWRGTRVETSRRDLIFQEERGEGKWTFEKGSGVPILATRNTCARNSIPAHISILVQIR